MTDCPNRLTTGATLIVSVAVYILPSAFRVHLPPSKDEQSISLWKEGMETDEEKSLRERRSSILKLFDVIGLRPENGVNLKELKTMEAAVHEATMKKPAHKRVEVVGDGEEIEVDDDDEDLSKNELDMIYKKWVVCHSSSLAYLLQSST